MTSPALISSLLIPLTVIPWDTIENDTNHFARHIKAKLMAKIKEAFKEFLKVTVKNACARFQSLLENVVKAESSYSE